MVSAEQFRARLDAAIEQTRAALGELTAIRAALAGERSADDGLPDDEIDALAERRAVRMRARSVRP